MDKQRNGLLNFMDMEIELFLPGSVVKLEIE